MLCPLLGHANHLLLLVLSVGSLVDSLGSYVEYQLLYEFWTQRHQHSEKEGSVDLLCLLQ